MFWSISLVLFRNVMQYPVNLIEVILRLRFIVLETKLVSVDLDDLSGVISN